MINRKLISAAAAVLMICALLAGCHKEQSEPERTSSDYVYHFSTASGEETQTAAQETLLPERTSSESTTETGTTAAEPVTAVMPTAAYTTVVYTTAAPQPTEPSSPAAPVTEAPATVPASAEETTAFRYDPEGEVDLSIVMPESNGKMKVDPSSSNRFVQKVADAKGVSPERMAAVMSVPDNGQNYVFEFRSGDGRGVDDLRRVFLLDSDGNILSVASSDSTLKVNLSPTENWFCMNVLIKGVIFPAIKDQF